MQPGRMAFPPAQQRGQLSPWMAAARAKQKKGSDFVLDDVEVLDSPVWSDDSDDDKNLAHVGGRNPSPALPPPPPWIPVQQQPLPRPLQQQQQQQQQRQPPHHFARPQLVQQQRMNKPIPHAENGFAARPQMLPNTAEAAQQQQQQPRNNGAPPRPTQPKPHQQHAVKMDNAKAVRKQPRQVHGNDGGFERQQQEPYEEENDDTRNTEGRGRHRPLRVASETDGDDDNADVDERYEQRGEEDDEEPTRDTFRHSVLRPSVFNSFGRSLMLSHSAHTDGDDDKAENGRDDDDIVNDDDDDEDEDESGSNDGPPRGRVLASVYAPSVGSNYGPSTFVDHRTTTRALAKNSHPQSTSQTAQPSFFSDPVGGGGGGAWDTPGRRGTMTHPSVLRLSATEGNFLFEVEGDQRDVSTDRRPNDTQRRTSGEDQRATAAKGSTRPPPSDSKKHKNNNDDGDDDLSESLRQKFRHSVASRRMSRASMVATGLEYDLKRSSLYSLAGIPADAGSVSQTGRRKRNSGDYELPQYPALEGTTSSPGSCRPTLTSGESVDYDGFSVLSAFQSEVMPSHRQGRERGAGGAAGDTDAKRLDFRYRVSSRAGLDGGTVRSTPQRGRSLNYFVDADTAADDHGPAHVSIRSKKATILTDSPNSSTAKAPPRGDEEEEFDLGMSWGWGREAAGPSKSLLRTSAPSAARVVVPALDQHRLSEEAKRRTEIAPASSPSHQGTAVGYLSPKHVLSSASSQVPTAGRQGTTPSDSAVAVSKKCSSDTAPANAQDGGSPLPTPQPQSVLKKTHTQKPPQPQRSSGSSPISQGQHNGILEAPHSSAVGHPEGESDLAEFINGGYNLFFSGEFCVPAATPPSSVPPKATTTGPEILAEKRNSEDLEASMYNYDFFIVSPAASVKSRSKTREKSKGSNRGLPYSPAKQKSKHPRMNDYDVYDFLTPSHSPPKQQGVAVSPAASAPRSPRPRSHSPSYSMLK